VLNIYSVASYFTNQASGYRIVISVTLLRSGAGKSLMLAVIYSIVLVGIS